MSDTKSNPIKEKPPIPIRKGMTFPSPAAFGSNFAGQNFEQNEGEITVDSIHFNESELKELDDFQIEYQSDEDENQDENDDRNKNHQPQQTERQALNVLSDKTNQSSERNVFLDRLSNENQQLRFSFGKFNDDLLLNESANILINNSGNLSRSLHKSSLESNKSVNRSTKNQNDELDDSKSKPSIIEQMFRQSFENIKRITNETVNGDESKLFNKSSARNSSLGASRSHHQQQQQFSNDMTLDADNKENLTNVSFDDANNTLLMMYNRNRTNVESQMEMANNAEMAANGNNENDTTVVNGNNLSIDPHKETPASSSSSNDNQRHHLTLSNSIFFKPHQGDLSIDTNSMPTSSTENLNVVAASFGESPINFASSGSASTQSDAELNPFESSDTNMKIRQELMATDGFDEFVSAEDYQAILDKDEQINRKEFASNDLTLNEPSMASQEKTPWWNAAMIQQQTSKLELSSFNSSNMPSSSDDSMSSACRSGNKMLTVPTLGKRKSQSPNRPIDESVETRPEKLVDESRSKKVVNVDKYFTRASDFPDLCAQSAPGIDLSQWPEDDVTKTSRAAQSQRTTSSQQQQLQQQQQQTLASQVPKTAAVSSAKPPTSEEAASSNEDDLTFSNSQTYANGMSSSNFSFTFNANETGDILLVKKSKDADNNKQLFKKPDAGKSSSKSDELNLDKIGEELKNISERLNPDEKNGDSSENNKMMLDSNKKSSSKMPNITGSLTSTPSKLKRASSKSNKDLTKSVNSDTSSLNIVSGAPQMRKLGKLHANSIDMSTESSSNNLFTQESFISSIPERTANDSTLSVKSRHKPSHYHQHKKQKQKHAEIQTSPEQSSTFTSSTTIEVPTSKFGTKTTDDSAETDHDKAKLSNRLSTVSNVSSMSTRSNVVPQSSGHDLNALNNFTNSMISNSGSTASMANSGSFVPVAFVPIDTFFPCVRKMYDSVQPQQQQSFANPNMSQASQFSMGQNSGSQPFSASHQNTLRYSNNEFDPFNNRLNIDTSTKYANTLIHSNLHSSLPSVSSMASSARSMSELPQIDLGYNKIDFGMVAEGCRETERVSFSIANVRQLNENGFIQVEVSDSSDWLIGELKPESAAKFDSDSKIVGEYSELKAKLSKAFSVHLSRESSASTNKSKKSHLRLTIESNVCEFFVHMDTREINYFREQLQYRKNSGHHDSNEQLLPLVISAKLLIYYCAENAIESSKKSLIRQLELKMILGYAHLKSSSNINSIEFSFPDYHDLDADDTFLRPESLKSKNDDIDKTFTGNSLLDNAYIKTNVDPKAIQFSNAGNVNIKINCYFNYEESEKVHHKFQLLSFNEYEIKIEKPVVFLEANLRATKPQVFLHGNIRKRHQSNEDSNVPMAAFEQNKIKLIIEIAPNGTSFEIPVRLRLNKQIANRSKLQQPQRQSSSSSLISSNEKLRLNASKSILFFGRAIFNRKDKLSTINNHDVNNQAVNELLLQNINSVPIRCELVLIDSIETKTRSYSSLDTLSTTQTADIPFRFHAETLGACRHFDESKKTVELSMEPGKLQVIKLEYIGLNKSIPLASAYLRIRIIDTLRYFHVSLIGFSRDTFLDIENASPLNLFERMKSLDSETAKSSFFMQLLNNKIRQYSYFTEMNRFIPPVQPKLSQRSNYRKLIILKNKSPTSKCVVYPLLFDADLNRQLNANTKIEEKNISNEKWYDLGTDKMGQRSILKILYKMNTVNKYTNSYANDGTKDLYWFELQPNEEYHLNFELITILENQSLSSSSMGQSYMSNDNLDSFFLALLWIEHDINSYCVLNYQQAIALNDPNNKKSSSCLLEKILEKIISQNNLATRESMGAESSYRMMNRSTSSSMSSLISIDQSILSVNGSSNKSFNRCDFVNLIKSAFKCSLISIGKSGTSSTNSSIANDSITRVTNQLPDYYFAASDQEISTMSSNDESMKSRRLVKSASMNLENSNLKNFTSLDSSSTNKFDSMSFNERSDLLLKSSASSSRLNEFRSKPNVTESWSVSNRLIVIQNIQKDKPIGSYGFQFFIQNNLSTKNLRFDIQTDSFMISFDRLKFELMPLEKIGVKVIPTREIFNKQKWDGYFSIWCNNLQKSVRVILSTSYVDETSLADSTLMDDSSFKHPGSIVPSDSSTPFIANPNFVKPPINGQQQYNQNQRLETINDHDTLESQIELAQSTLDSMSITPLMNASYSQQSTFDASFNKESSKFMTPELREKMNDETPQSIQLAKNLNDDKVIIDSSEPRTVKFFFPKIATMTKKPVVILFSNPTKSNVYWEATPLNAPVIRDYRSRHTGGSPSVFTYSPRSGRLLYSQQQPITIEFNPGDIFGQFSQAWEIRTWADNGNTSQESYSCQMTLNGESTLPDSRLLLKDIMSRSSSRLDGSKDSLTMVSSMASRSTSALHSDRSSSSSAMNSSSASSVASSLTSKASTTKKVNLKESQVTFADIAAGQSTKSFLIVNNPDDVKHTLIIRPLVDPFYCKHSKVEVDSKHCIKIPVEFRPRACGDYADKIYICVDSDDQALTCILKAKCISTK